MRWSIKGLDGKLAVQLKSQSAALDPDQGHGNHSLRPKEHNLEKEYIGGVFPPVPPHIMSTLYPIGGFT